MYFRSIGFKLTAWYIGMLGISFAVLFSISYGLLVLSLEHDMDFALEKIGAVMVEKVRAEDRAVHPGDIDALFARFLGFSPLNRMADVLEPPQEKNRNPDTSPELTISPETMVKVLKGETHFETMATGNRYPVRTLTLPVIQSGRVTRIVRVGMSLENMENAKHRFFLNMLAVFPLGLLLAGGGGWVLAKRALKPVDRITRTAREICGSRITQRIDQSGNGDELDRLAGTLNTMLDRLNQAFDQMRQFSGDASHELQTPLTILKGEMEVALMKERTPEEYREVLQSGLEEIDRINHLVEGLLLLARADSGVMGLDLQPVDLEGFMTRIMGQMESIASAAGIAMGMSRREGGAGAQREPVMVSADGAHLKRALFNLIGNGIKYSRPGGRVLLRLVETSGSAVIEICDSGMGIPEPELEKIFNRFHRSPLTGARDREGVGLGLSIADSIIKAHGGRIEVESVPEQGSIFRVVLPLVSGAEDRPEIPAAG